MDKAVENLHEFMQKDLEQTLRKNAITSGTNPITVESASKKPLINEVTKNEGSRNTGVIPPHPLALMTKISENCPWVDLSNRVIGAACASTMPLYRIDTPNKKRKTDVERITDLLKYPNPHQTGYELFKTTYEDLGLYANAYWQIIKDRKDDLHSIYTLPPETIRKAVYFDEYGIMHIAFIQIDALGGNKVDNVYLEDEIIDFKTSNNRSFLYGKPNCVSLMVHIASNISAAKAVASWFEQGFVGGAIFKGDSDPDTAKRNREYLKEFYSKPENFGRTMLLEGDMELIRDGNKFQDMDFSKLNETDRDNILNVCGVPVSQAGIRSSAGNANAEVVAAEESAFHRNTVAMYHNYVFEKLNSKLFRQILGWKDVTISAGVPTKFSNKDAIETVRAMGEFGIKVNEVRDLLSGGRVESELAGNTYLIKTNNGCTKFNDVVGIDLATGEECETIFDRMGSDDGTSGATNKAKEFKGASGLGGPMKKAAEKGTKESKK